MEVHFLLWVTPKSFSLGSTEKLSDYYTKEFSSSSFTQMSLYKLEELIQSVPHLLTCCSEHMNHRDEFNLIL